MKERANEAAVRSGPPGDAPKLDAFQAWLAVYRESVADSHRKSYDVKETRLPGHDSDKRETG